MNTDKRLKIAIIAGAAAAAKYLKENKSATSEEAISYVNKKINEILANIDTN